MSKLLAVLVAIFAAAWFATPALAWDDPAHAYIQICKATGTPAMHGPFTFTVAGESYNVRPGDCTAPIQVDAADFASDSVATLYGHNDLGTVSETAHPWFKITALDYRDANGGLHALDPPVYDSHADAYDVNIPVTRGDESKTTIVHFTDDPVMGTLEICKYPQSGSNATGTFTFSISSRSMDDPTDEAVGWIDNLPAPANVNVTIGSCSTPIAVPAGASIVKELPTNGQLFVTKINVTPIARTIHNFVEHGWAKVYVPPTVDELGETKVDFYNSLATLKVCKVAADDTAVDLGPYSFTATGAAAAFTLAPVEHAVAVCHEVGQLAPGTQATVTEATVPGTAVSDISLLPGPFITDPKAPYVDVVNEAARTVSFYMRPGLNEIVFTNDPAASVPLKVCKLPGTLTGTFSFTTTGLTGYVKPFWGIAPEDDEIATAPTTFTVPPGQCTWVGYFPYDGTITIAEASGNLTGVTIDPASSTAVLVGSPNLAARSAAVLLGSYATWDQCRFFDLFPAIVDFTNGAPAPGTTAPVAPAAVVAAAAPTATVVSTSAPSKVTTVKKALKVSSAKIVSIGKVRYVVVRVNGAAKTARIHVTLLNKQHKVVSRVTRYVATNKAVRVGNLRLPPSILSVKVAL